MRSCVLVAAWTEVGPGTLLGWGRACAIQLRLLHLPRQQVGAWVAVGIRVNLTLGIVVLKVFAVGLVFNLLVLIALVAVRADRGTTQSTRLTTDVVGQLPPIGRRSGLALTHVTAEARLTPTPRLQRALNRSWTRRRRNNNNSHYSNK